MGGIGQDYGCGHRVEDVCGHVGEVAGEVAGEAGRDDHVRHLGLCEQVHWPWRPLSLVGF